MTSLLLHNVSLVLLHDVTLLLLHNVTFTPEYNLIITSECYTAGYRDGGNCEVCTAGTFSNTYEADHCTTCPEDQTSEQYYASKRCRDGEKTTHPSVTMSQGPSWLAINDAIHRNGSDSTVSRHQL